jgi:hypothetical protein
LAADGQELRLDIGHPSAVGGQMSSGLVQFCLDYSTKLSYADVAGLIARVTGEPCLCDQTVWALVQAEAVCLSTALAERVARTHAVMPALCEQVDVYSPDPEVLLYADGILVTRQKKKRDSRKTAQATDIEPLPKDRSSKATASGRVNTDVLMLQKRAGTFEYITAGIDSHGEEVVGVEAQARAFLAREYGALPEHGPLRLVALTDGAQAIRTQFKAIAGKAIAIILDWYHLCKKVREKMTMVARNKEEKRAHLKQMVCWLWHGKTTAVIDYLRTQVACRNERVRDELVVYLQNRESEIIDYERRRQAGKPIGSGRMEKGVDQVVGQRQKQKAMSWSDKGSKALAILKVAQLNGHYNNTQSLAAVTA